eukprot:scpid37347/ scgid17246/ 
MLGPAALRSLTRCMRNMSTSTPMPTPASKHPTATPATVAPDMPPELDPKAIQIGKQNNIIMISSNLAQSLFYYLKPTFQMPAKFAACDCCMRYFLVLPNGISRLFCQVLTVIRRQCKSDCHAA